MKMVFFSSDELEMEQVERELVHAGIPCAVVAGPVPEGSFPGVAYTELWIQDDQDWHRALLLCVGLELGFAKRPRKADMPNFGGQD